MKRYYENVPGSEREMEHLLKSTFAVRMCHRVEGDKNNGKYDIEIDIDGAKRLPEKPEDIIDLRRQILAIEREISKNVDA